ncbi:MAG TPA: exopolysaccharide biosynthesis polyprenyl glycosylphosphotransferase [Opitutaceae bacterium]|jgi:exopolysaccharide biosynthesis polyprenyl glycosylphosphotransferase|nr:exopolysaccharide biosynthesis polyprenyl glycosylphosphotransferase [Opitutaceae bacterium]
MLKDRKEGVVYLHWCSLTVAASGVYLGWLAFAKISPGFHGVQGPNVLLYLFGVVIASCWMHRGLHLIGHRLGDMGLIESIRHSRQQLFRFVIVLFTLAFVIKDNGLSRKFLFGYILLMALVLTVANMYFPKIIVRLFFRKKLMRTVLVAKPDEVMRLHDMLAARQHLGIKIVGWVGDGESGTSNQILLPKLGALDDLRRVLQEHDVAQVVVSQHSFPPGEGRAIAQCAEEAACRVRFFAHVQRYFPSESVSVEHEGQFTFVTQANEPLENPVNRLLKRVLDISVSLPVVLFVLPPLTLFVWLMQRRQSAGPVVHRQYRSGLNRKKFLIYKYRTMHVANSAAALTRQAQANDSRIFPFGRFLRRTSLDEFPQFLNVLMGDMSVSGPRPHLLEHDEQFSKIVNSYYTRHFVKPGITGLAQTRGFRGEISEPSLLHKRIGYDMIYIRRWTLSLDLQILFQTVSQVVFPPRSAY